MESPPALVEPLVSIFQLQDADRSPLLAHVHRLRQEGRFKEVSETLAGLWARDARPSRESAGGQEPGWVGGLPLPPPSRGRLRGPAARAARVRAWHPPPHPTWSAPHPGPFLPGAHRPLSHPWAGPGVPTAEPLPGTLWPHLLSPSWKRSRGQQSQCGRSSQPTLCPQGPPLGPRLDTRPASLSFCPGSPSRSLGPVLAWPSSYSLRTDPLCRSLWGPAATLLPGRVGWGMCWASRVP